MRVAVVTAPGTVELVDEPTPAPGPEELVVEVAACGLCTMERRLFVGEKQIYPVAPGHEVAGRVVARVPMSTGWAGCPQSARWSRSICSPDAGRATHAGGAAPRGAGGRRAAH